MRIAIVGGKLQGLEIVYLARKAGFETILFDQKSDVPARNLCHTFVEYNFTSKGALPEEYADIDLIFPALENTAALTAIEKWADQLGIPMVFDLESFRLSRSKKQSNALFTRLDLPLPRSWPGCSFPLVVKPDCESGSRGVSVVFNGRHLDVTLKSHGREVVIQEFLEGPTYSIEVVGRSGEYSTPQVTDLYMDKTYDCMRVTAPTILDIQLEKRLQSMACIIAEELCLEGIMDLEVILHKGKLKVLEIDARFPSQTPITVYWSTGQNMVTMLVNLFAGDTWPIYDVPEDTQHTRHTIIEHILVKGNSIETCGEHIIATDGPLKSIAGFYGAEEALTSYDQEKEKWVATLIYTAGTKEGVERKRLSSLKRIRAGLEDVVLDSSH